MTRLQNLEIPISGMDCAECTQHVQHAIEKLPGVHSVQVFLATEKAIVRLDPDQTELSELRAAVRAAGYDVPASDAIPAGGSPLPAPVSMDGFNRRLTFLLVGVFALILSAVVFGEFLGWFDFLNERVPFALRLALVLAGGYPVFLNVLRAALRRQVISHTLMTLGVIAALAIGQWATAALVVLFMRIGDYVENGTADCNIPPVQNQNLAEALSAVIGADKVTYVSLEGAGHGGPQFETAENIAKVIAFLDKYLK